MPLIRLAAALWLAFVAAPLAAQNFPLLTGRVVDQAHLLSAEQVVDLTSKSQALEAQTGRQLVIATVTSLEGRPIEDYATLLGRAWKIGEKDKDNGVILLVAPNERKVFIATGYGAGGFLTDAMAGEIIRNRIIPRFKQGDYGGGISAGTDAIIQQMSLPPDQARDNANAAAKAEKQREQGGGSALPILFWLFVIGFILLSRLRRAPGRRYRRGSGGISPWVVLWGLNELSRGSRGGGSSWSGGGSSWGGGGGGFGGFSGGGGSFGGGGASGSW